MAPWFFIVFSICLSVLLRHLFFTTNNKNKNKKQLPPGPSYLSSNLVLLGKSFSELEPILKDFKSKYGPLITLSFGSRPTIFVGTHSLAHQLLIHHGALSSDRPPSFHLLSISSAAYGPTWRLLRRNLASEILHPSRVKSYSWARQWVLRILIGRLLQSPEAAADGIPVVEHFRYAMFCLLVLMCFGEKLDDHRINEIEKVQRRLLLTVGTGRYNVFGIWPRFGRLFFGHRLKELRQVILDQRQVLIPLIRNRIESAKDSKPQLLEEERIVAYVDTFLNLQLPKEESKNGDGKLTDQEMVSLCSEFLNAGTDTTSTALQWIMANLVKNPQVQEKLYEEIVGVMGTPPRPPRPQEELPELVMEEDDLEKMPYLKAVVLEGLRRHPPGHFVLPHKVMEDVELQGYVVPEGATINFMVAEMGWDPKVWDEPMEFKPERFLLNHTSGFDITGSKEIKMMPFGAGRRICPGSDLALLHLEYFVANLIWYFQWTAVDGDVVDLSEKQEFTVVMKNPLRAHVTPRVN